MLSCEQKNNGFLRRLSELVAFVSASATVFLLLQVRELSHRLQQIQDPNIDLSAFGNVRSGKSNADYVINKPIEPTMYAFKFDSHNLNNTRKATKDILFFNRVPKAGSQTVMELLKSLSVQNHFTFHKDRARMAESIQLTNNEEKWLANMVDYFKPPTAYVKHVSFINFTQFDLNMPIYINMVREPVERVISWFYYARAPWYFVERKRAFPDLPLPNSKWLRKDFAICVKNGNEECVYQEGKEREDFGQLTEFFCGQDDECTGFNSDIALKRAKENVEKHYAVVGVLEELNKTLTVLEHYVPRFFKGALKAYQDGEEKYSKINRNIYKPTIKESTKEVIRQNFTREIEFYEYCKQRLHNQYLALNLNEEN